MGGPVWFASVRYIQVVGRKERVSSSVGQSTVLIRRGSLVRFQLAPPGLVSGFAYWYMGDQLSWESACFARRRSSVRSRYPPPLSATIEGTQNGTASVATRSFGRNGAKHLADLRKSGNLLPVLFSDELSSQELGSKLLFNNQEEAQQSIQMAISLTRALVFIIGMV